MHLVVLLPTHRTGSVGALPAADGPVLQHEVGGHEAAPALHEARQKGVGDAERRIRHDVEVATRQTQVRGIGLHDDDGVAEARSQVCCAAGMQLDRDHPRADVDERLRERPRPGADVENEVARANS